MNGIAVAVAVILFPGLIATVIADKITVHVKRWDSFKYSIYSFIFGVSCYVQILAWLNYRLPEGFQFLRLPVGALTVWSLVTDVRTKIDLFEVFMASLLSIPVAFSAAFLVN